MEDTETYQGGMSRRRDVDASKRLQQAVTSARGKVIASSKRQTPFVRIVAAVLLLSVALLAAYVFFQFRSPQPETVDPEKAQARFLLDIQLQPASKTIVVFDQTQMYEGDENIDGFPKTVTVYKHQQGNSSVDLCGVIAQLMELKTSTCTLWSRNGIDIRSYVDLVEDKPYYAYLKERLFLWPSVRRGFRQATTVAGKSGIPIEIETLALRPRIYRVYNYISLEDVDTFLAESKKLAMTRSTGGLRRKDTGAGDEILTRTSENAWDTTSAHAKQLKDLAMDFLRIPHHDGEFLDGFQVVKYQPGQSYNTHTDWFSLDSGRGWNWDPATGGSNRWATLFLYLSNVTLGGETMFPLAGDMPPTDNATQEEIEALKNKLFKPGAWEHGIVDECRKKFRVVPQVGEAILFYHQSSTGKLDELAKHAACPVLIGDKMGANLWVWNSQRWSAERAEVGEKREEEEINQGTKGFTATFKNEYGPVDVFWAGPGKEVFQFSSNKNETMTRNTFKGHKFVVRDQSEGKPILTNFVMDPKTIRTYTIPSEL